MLNLITGSTVVALYLNQVSVKQIEDVEKNLTPSQRTELLRVCEKEDQKDYERCKMRQIARSRVTGGKSKPTEAYELYEKQDWSMGRLRERLRARMIVNNQKKLTERRTYREFEPEQTAATEKRPYINDLKEEQLRCMTEVPHGRPRNICLDELRNKIRKEMRANRGSMRIIQAEDVDQ